MLGDARWGAATYRMQLGGWAGKTGAAALEVGDGMLAGSWCTACLALFGL
jgi:hypothetical protein